MKSRKLVLIEWIDSHSPSNRWERVESLSCKPVLATSVGFVMNENREGIQIVAHFTGSEERDIEYAGGAMFIPKCAIRSRKAIKG